ncbi:MAG: helix-turn-helix transcriptional regulator [Richelia sp. RM2_1_2]|nr:helix-turn-helix transcriptional regulator [Richelia sp. SM1_7_0]NJN09884.1 helix-turn-helix transcriptional regulator [Richelia sp. RM1_1_1]NJO29033.1 helix-turn-helix transcriptional regulator [Richelia sp. SL_2_1]NJO56874.1 helix-turn-helix transcriptional regulator [Richelia sp. RM2_1_2]
MDTQSRQKLIEIIKLARGSMTQRAFGIELGVSATAVQMWEKGVKTPDTENLDQIATRAGYTLQELLYCVKGKPLPEISDLNMVLRQINNMPLSEVAQVVQAGAARLAAAPELSGNQEKATSK